MSKDISFTNEKHVADDDTPYPLTFSLHCVHVQKGPRACGHHAHMLKTHVRVVPACTGFPACHTPHTPHTTHHTTTHHNNTTTTPHGDRHRERQRQGEKRRRKRRRQENIREKREQRRFIFSMVVHGSSLLIECFFWLIPFARETSACLIGSSTVHL